MEHPIVKVINTIDSKSCPYNINFHCHTTFSDGSLNPSKLYEQACELNLKHIAITDHHSVEAYRVLSEELIKSNKPRNNCI